MPKMTSAVDMFNREFLEIRARLLEVAAALDRIDRREGASGVVADPRYAHVTQAIGILTDGQSERAERVQMLFSDPYEPLWQKNVEFPQRG